MKTYMPLLAALTLLPTLAACGTDAPAAAREESGYATGLVVDTRGEPIAGAELIPLTGSKPLAPAAKTDAAGNGEYNFEWTTPVPDWMSVGVWPG